MVKIITIKNLYCTFSYICNLNRHRLPNKTIHKEESKKSVISISELGHDPLDVYHTHLIEWNMSTRHDPNKSALSALNVVKDRFGRFNIVVPTFVSKLATQDQPNYKNWIATKISHDKELKSIELLSQFKMYINTVRVNLIEKKYNIFDIYLNKNSLKAIFVVNEEDVINDDFITAFYDLAFLYEEQFRKKFKKEINLSFLGNDNIDQNELKVDKFFKLEDGK